MFVAITFSCILGAAYHVKCGFAEYVFLQLGRDRKAKDMMLDLLNCAPILQTCGVGVFVYIDADHCHCHRDHRIPPLGITFYHCPLCSVVVPV